MPVTVLDAGDPDMTETAVNSLYKADILTEGR